MLTGASRYWVGGTNTWNTTAGTKWATTSGGSGGASVPSTSDTVFFDANSGNVTITKSGAVVIAAMVCTGFTGTFAGSGNISFFKTGRLVIVSAMTITWSSDFLCGANVTVSVTTNGKSMPSMRWDAGTLKLIDNFTSASGKGVYLTTSGAINLNGFNLTTEIFSITSSGTVNLGSGTLEITGTTALDFSDHSGTLTESTSTILISGASTSFTGDGETFYKVRFTGLGTSGFTINGANTYTYLEIEPAATGFKKVILAANQTVSSNVKLTGYDAAANRLFIVSNTLGTARTITCNGSLTSWTNTDMRDITGAGSVTWTGGTSTGDAGGNSNITFSTPVKRYWVGDAGNWSSTGEWSSSSGGSSGASVPICHDTCIFNANSGTGTVTADCYRIGKLDFSAAPANLNLTLSVATEGYKDWILKSGMAMTVNSSLDFYGVGSHNITCNTTNLNSSGNNTIFYRGTYTTTDAMICSGGLYVIGTATLNFANASHSLTSFFVNAGSPTVSLAGTISITGTTGGILEISAGTITKNDGIIKTTGTVIGPVTISISKSIFELYLDNQSTSSSNSVNIISAGTFDTLRATRGGEYLKFTNGITQTITGGLKMTGSAGNLITLVSASAGSAFTLSKSSGTVCTDYLSIKDCTASGGATWWAGANSTNVSGNSGWVFQQCSGNPPPAGNAIWFGINH